MNKGYDLYNAVKKGNIEMIRNLISQGADVNYVFQPEVYGYTPLHMAAYYAMNKIIELLVDNGANINVYSLDGKTPLALAVERHNREETVELLLRCGAHDGTAPIPDYASIGEIFLTTDNNYWLIVEGGKIQEYQKFELQNLLEKRKSLSLLGKEVEISFDNDTQSKTKVYYAFSLSEKEMVAEVKGNEEIGQTIPTVQNKHRRHGR